MSRALVRLGLHPRYENGGVEGAFRAMASGNVAKKTTVAKPVEVDPSGSVKAWVNATPVPAATIPNETANPFGTTNHFTAPPPTANQPTIPNPNNNTWNSTQPITRPGTWTANNRQFPAAPAEDWTDEFKFPAAPDFAPNAAPNTTWAPQLNESFNPFTDPVTPPATGPTAEYLKPLDTAGSAGSSSTTVTDEADAGAAGGDGDVFADEAAVAKGDVGQEHMMSTAWNTVPDTAADADAVVDTAAGAWPPQPTAEPDTTAGAWNDVPTFPTTTTNQKSTSDSKDDNNSKSATKGKDKSKSKENTKAKNHSKAKAKAKAQKVTPPAPTPPASKASGSKSFVKQPHWDAGPGPSAWGAAAPPPLPDVAGNADDTWGAALTWNDANATNEPEVANADAGGTWNTVNAPVHPHDSASQVSAPGSSSRSGSVDASRHSKHSRDSRRSRGHSHRTAGENWGGEKSSKSKGQGKGKNGQDAYYSTGRGSRSTSKGSKTASKAASSTASTVGGNTNIHTNIHTNNHTSNNNNDNNNDWNVQAGATETFPAAGDGGGDAGDAWGTTGGQEASAWGDGNEDGDDAAGGRASGGGGW